MWNLGVWTLDDLEGKFKIEVSCEVALGEQQADQSGDGALWIKFVAMEVKST